MRDITFFEIYKDKQDRKARNRLIINMILLIIIVGVISTVGVNIITAMGLKSEIAVLRETIDNPILKEKVKVIALKNEEIAQYDQEIININLLSSTVDSDNNINVELVKEVFNRVKPEMFLESFSILENNISLRGIAKDKETISEFEHSLESVERFEYIFVSTITNYVLEGVQQDQADVLKFDMTIKMVEKEKPVYVAPKKDKDKDKPDGKEVKKNE